MKATKISKKAYTRHSVEYKTEALKLAERVGVPEAARQLGLHESQLYRLNKHNLNLYCYLGKT